MGTEVTKLIDRRRFLRGGYLPTSGNKHLNPPWSLPQLRYIQNCTRCSECIDVCPENILIHSNNDFPRIDFNLGGCTFCGKCVQVCGDNAFFIKSMRTQCHGPTRYQLEKNVYHCMVLPVAPVVTVVSGLQLPSTMKQVA
jgi:ferredoxin-type protein NapF